MLTAVLGSCCKSLYFILHISLRTFEKWENNRPTGIGPAYMFFQVQTWENLKWRVYFDDDRRPEIAVLYYGHPNRKYLYLWRYNRYRRNSNRKPGFSTTARSTKVFSGHCINDRQPEIAVETENTYIIQITSDRIEIPVAWKARINVGNFGANKDGWMGGSDCYNDRQVDNRKSRYGSRNRKYLLVYLLNCAPAGAAKYLAVLSLLPIFSRFIMQQKCGLCLNTSLIKLSPFSGL